MKKILLVCCLWVITFYTYSQKQIINTDRFLEIDLYWFDRANISGSVEVFWERFHPLFENIEGEKAIILNIGWTMDYIFQWSGRLKDSIPFPENMHSWPWFKDQGQLTGNTEERMRKWKERFENAGDWEAVKYDDWTYLEFKKLVLELRDHASVKYGFKEMRIGSLVIAWENIYSGEVSSFSKRQSQLFLNDVFFWRPLDVTALMREDNTVYGAFPDGVNKMIPVTKFFGEQWGSFSKAVGLDAIVLRDSGLGPGIYRRKGPYGMTAPENPDLVREWSDATADLVRYTKEANPDAFVMGYSNSASAVGDWRINCVDLESIAKQGYMDAFIDQSWAGAWNEVGQRPHQFWNSPKQGWTYQLSQILVHAAVLDQSPVKHYILTETFDAWESWDIIHNALDRLKWGIWAYSHAALKTPDGLKMPDGNYISWANQGKRLLSEEDVSFLVDNSNEAFYNASITKEVCGPTLVYNREAMEWMSSNEPERTIKEWIDEQSGTIMKWSVPIMSITRSEYLGQVSSDMFIVQTPVQLEQKVKGVILSRIERGDPIMLIGSPAGGIDQDILQWFGLKTEDDFPSKIEYLGSLKGKVSETYEDISNTFLIYQPFTNNELSSENSDVLYYVKDSPVLIQKENTLLWDAPEFAWNLQEKDTGVLDELLGSPYPFVITARAINNLLSQSENLFVDSIAVLKPVFYSSWKTSDGNRCVLTGNLEEGLNHTGNYDVSLQIHWNTQERQNAKDMWSGDQIHVEEGILRVKLKQAEAKLYLID